MTLTLIFLLIAVSFSFWWLSHQRLASKPWLEVGIDPASQGQERDPVTRRKAGLIVFLGIVGIFFALFGSGYLMRQELADWRSIPMPPVVWLSTGLLALASVSLHFAVRAAHGHNRSSVNFWLLASAVVTVGFLTGQAMAWQNLINAGFVLTANPANGFFFILTGLHGLHILGGLIALAHAGLSAVDNAPLDRLRPRLELCAIYWHFLFAVWVTLLAIMLGWAYDPFINAHHNLP